MAHAELSPRPGSKPNCLTCPNRIEAADSAVIVGRSINGDICLAKKRVINSAKMEPEARRKLGETIAAGCDSYCKPAPAGPTNVFQVGLPEFGRVNLSEPKPKEWKPLPTCKSCINFIPERTVASTYGWNAGMCAARGELILANKFAITASNCDLGVFGGSDAKIENVKLFPEYTDAFSPTSDPIGLYLSTGALLDPLEYEFDEPPSDEDRNEHGILGWRYIRAPHNDSIYASLPVFDPKSFTEEERDAIPRSGDDEHPELYIDHAGLTYTVAALWSGLGEVPATWGQPGLGKTELFRHLAWLMQVPFTRLSITGSTELDDLAGKSGYSPERGTFFRYGRLPRDWTCRRVIVIDEPNTGPADVWQFLRPLMDNSKQLALDMNEGEIVAKHRFCYWGMAMNPAWDPLNVGALQIGSADASRLFHISVELPPEKIERQIIQSRVKVDGWTLPKRDLDLIMKIAADIRALSTAGALPITWGIREQIKVARAWRWYEPRRVYAICIGDYMGPEERQQLTSVLNTYLTS